MKAFSVALWAASAVQTVSGYWMEDIEHRGRSAYNPDPDYQVFRNVKEFGAKGDGGEGGLPPNTSQALTLGSDRRHSRH